MRSSLSQFKSPIISFIAHIWVAVQILAHTLAFAHTASVGHRKVAGKKQVETDTPVAAHPKVDHRRVADLYKHWQEQQLAVAFADLV